jgi:hypothetical protein
VDQAADAVVAVDLADVDTQHAVEVAVARPAGGEVGGLNAAG